jgi:hypothetical protein
MQKFKWKELPTGFVEAADFARDACSKDMSKPVLTCVSIAEDGRVESSDNYRVLRYTLEGGMPVPGFLLPGVSAGTVTKLNPVKIAKTPGWVHFQTEEGTEISCRVFENDKFPTIEHVLNFEGVDIQLPKTLSEVLERAAVFSKRDFQLDETMTVTIGAKRLVIRSEDPGKGWFEESVNLKYEGPEMEFLITPYLVKNILSQTGMIKIGTQQMKFQGERWEYVAMLKSIQKKK